MWRPRRPAFVGDTEPLWICPIGLLDQPLQWPWCRKILMKTSARQSEPQKILRTDANCLDWLLPTHTFYRGILIARGNSLQSILFYCLSEPYEISVVSLEELSFFRRILKCTQMRTHMHMHTVAHTPRLQLSVVFWASILVSEKELLCHIPMFWKILPLFPFPISLSYPFLSFSHSSKSFIFLFPSISLFPFFPFPIFSLYLNIYCIHLYINKSLNIYIYVSKYIFIYFFSFLF